MKTLAVIFALFLSALMWTVLPSFPVGPDPYVDHMIFTCACQALGLRVDSPAAPLASAIYSGMFAWFASLRNFLMISWGVPSATSFAWIVLMASESLLITFWICWPIWDSSLMSFLAICQRFIASILSFSMHLVLYILYSSSVINGHTKPLQSCSGMGSWASLSLVASCSSFPISWSMSPGSHLVSELWSWSASWKILLMISWGVPLAAILASIASMAATSLWMSFHIRWPYGASWSSFLVLPQSSMSSIRFLFMHLTSPSSSSTRKGQTKPSQSCSGGVFNLALISWFSSLLSSSDSSLSLVGMSLTFIASRSSSSLSSRLSRISWSPPGSSSSSAMSSSTLGGVAYGGICQYFNVWCLPAHLFVFCSLSVGDSFAHLDSVFFEGRSSLLNVDCWLRWM